MATILLVDDDASFAAALVRMLANDGHRARIAADTTAALDEIRRRPADVDLVITDVDLRQESGLNLLRELHRQSPALPVILLSAAPDAAGYLQALRLGAYEYLAKPVDYAELREVTRRALRSPEGTP